MEIRIDLGCGKNKVEGCIGVDIHRGDNPDIVADIRKPIPGISEGCADFVVCRHVLEHLAEDEWRDVMREVARLLGPGKRFEIHVPHPACENAMIHGHKAVLTPLFWQHMQQGLAPFIDGLAIDRVVEIPWPPALEYCREKGLNFDKESRFMWNAYYETEIHGHRV